MSAGRASGALMIPVPGVDLCRTPWVRWRWRVLEWPEGADGRFAARDDQAIGTYLAADGVVCRTSLAYRWETDTPVGATGMASYVDGFVKVRRTCLRNSEGGEGFVVEERNVAVDWTRQLGADRLRG